MPQSQIGKNIQKLRMLRMYSATYPTVLDIWFVMVALIVAFGHTVPWWVWAFGVQKFLIFVLKVVEYKLANKET